VHPIDNFVEFAVRVMDKYHPLNGKQTLVDAGILSVLLAMLTDEIEDQDLLPSPGIKNSDTSSADTWNMLDSIRRQGIRPYLKTSKSTFPFRRRILCDAFRVFYDGGDIAETDTLSSSISFFFGEFGM
jgi:hypothetical protein